MRGDKMQKQKYDCVESFKQNLFCSQDKPVDEHYDNLSV